MLVPLIEIQRINRIDQCSSNIHGHTSHLGLVKNAHPDSSGLNQWQDLRFSIHKLSDDATVASPEANVRSKNAAHRNRR